jgi:hypothetical protein
MLVTGNDILSYHGDAALGLNSGGIEHYGDTDLHELNNSIFNTQYLNMQKNKAVWDQKIQDRDAAMELVKNGALNVGNALPEDRKRLKEMVDGMKQTWLDHSGDLKSDPNVWYDFNDKLADFKDLQTIAASRFLDYHHGQAEAAKETNPIRKRKMIEHWDSQLGKPIEEQFSPYQQTMDWDPSVVLPEMTSLTAKKRDGFNDVITSVTDVGKAYRDYVTRYEFDDKNETAPNVDAFYDNFFGADGLKNVVSVGQSVNAVNNRLKKIASDMGFNPEDTASLPNFLRPLQLVSQDPTTGKPGTTDTKQVAAFKVALAYKYQNTTTSEFNKLYAAEAKTKAEIEKLGAEKEAQRALAAQRRSYIPYNQARAHYWNSKGTDQDNSNQVQNIFDDVVARSKKVPFKDGTADVVWVGDLPKGFSQVLSGVDKDGKPIALKPLKRANGAEYFQVAPSSFYISPAGKRYSDTEIKNAFSHQNKFKTYQEFIDYLGKGADEGGAGYKRDTELIGANGRGTAQSTIQALRSLNNKSQSQKSDEVLFDETDNQQE